MRLVGEVGGGLAVEVAAEVVATDCDADFGGFPVAADSGGDNFGVNVRLTVEAYSDSGDVGRF